jgi:glycosidase
VRLDFPGGWPGYKINKFSAEGRTKRDDSIFQHMSKLANFRKTSTALTTGKFMQYVPENGVYVYFRYDDRQTVMVVMNTAKKEMKINIEKYKERTNGFSKMKNIITGELTPLKDFTVTTKESAVYELMK